jgi:hypothetical protein
MNCDENAIKAAAVISLKPVKALLEIYGYDAVYLAPIEDVHASPMIAA